jgi:hypothetical protein
LQPGDFKVKFLGMDYHSVIGVAVLLISAVSMFLFFTIDEESYDHRGPDRMTILK